MAVDVLVAVFKTCAEELLKIGAGVTVDVEAKASIVACISAVITVSLITAYFLTQTYASHGIASRQSLRSGVRQVRYHRCSCALCQD